MSKITEGDKAPDFNLPTNDEGTFRLSDKSGSFVVLFFYPKDDTSGCTQEAIEFTGLLGEFDKLGVVIAGMSPDPVKKHDKFRAKHELATTLISDEEKTTLDKYGIWIEKSMYGRKYMGVERTTLLIDPQGKVAKAWHKVKVPGHAEAVLDAARELST